MRPLILVLILTGCTSITKGEPIECEVTVHLDSIALTDSSIVSVDSVTATPEEYEEICIEAWKRE